MMLPAAGIISDYWLEVLPNLCPLCSGCGLMRTGEGVYVCADYGDYGGFEPGCHEVFRFTSPQSVEQDLRIIGRTSAALSAMRRRVQRSE